MCVSFVIVFPFVNIFFLSLNCSWEPTEGRSRRESRLRMHTARSELRPLPTKFIEKCIYLDHSFSRLKNSKTSLLYI
jgi:hypothetical protein